MKSIAAVSFLLALLAGAGELFAQAKVIKIEDETIYIGIGADRALKAGMKADVYEQAEPIVHPVTGENLGSPKVKIAQIEIKKVGPNFSAAKYLVQYAPVEVGDLVEGLEVAPTPEEEVRAEVMQARAEIKMLAQSLADEIKANQKAIADLQGTLRRVSGSEKRLNTLINAVRNMRERMVVMESKIENMEVQQQAMIARDTAEVGALSPAEMRDIQQRVVALEGRVVSIENMQVSGGGVPPAAPAGGTPPPMEEPLFPDEEMEGQGGFNILAYWWVAPIAAVGGVVLILLLKILSRMGKGAAPAAEEGDDEGFIEAGEDEEIPEPIPEPEELVEEQ